VINVSLSVIEILTGDFALGLFFHAAAQRRGVKILSSKIPDYTLSLKFIGNSFYPIL
jgi:hypothetical protein